MEEMTHASQLLELAGDDFIGAVYRAFLKRAPDRSGRDHFLNRLRAGDGKLAIIAAIANSPEAQTMRTSLEGTAELLALYDQQRKGKRNDALPLMRQINLIEHASGEANRKTALRLEQMETTLSNLHSVIARALSKPGSFSDQVSTRSSGLINEPIKPSIKNGFSVERADTMEGFLDNLKSSLTKASEADAFVHFSHSKTETE